MVIPLQRVVFLRVQEPFLDWGGGPSQGLLEDLSAVPTDHAAATTSDARRVRDGRVNALQKGIHLTVK